MTEPKEIEFENCEQAKREFEKMAVGQDVRDDDGYPYFVIYNNKMPVAYVELQHNRIYKIKFAR